MLKGNMTKLLRQAQDVQKQIENVQKELSGLIIDAESGGGMVSVKVNGKLEIVELNMLIAMFIGLGRMFAVVEAINPVCEIPNKAAVA